MCLTVSIQDLNFVTLEEIEFDADLDMTNLDITEMLATLEPEQKYVIRFTTACCGGTVENCTTNASFYAYFELQGDLSYRITGQSIELGPFGQNIVSPFVPSTAPNGPIVPYNIINIIGYDVQAAQNIPLTMTLYNTDCNQDPSDDNPIGTMTVNAIDGEVFSTGSFNIDGSSTEPCICYRLKIAYDDGCDQGTDIDNYYWQIGQDCVEDVTSESENKRVQIPNGTTFEILQNPILDNQLTFIFSTDNPLENSVDLTIYSADGKIMNKSKKELHGDYINFAFNAPTGVYFYEATILNKKFKGKFIK